MTRMREYEVTITQVGNDAIARLCVEAKGTGSATRKAIRGLYGANVALRYRTSSASNGEFYRTSDDEILATGINVKVTIVAA